MLVNYTENKNQVHEICVKSKSHKTYHVCLVILIKNFLILVGKQIKYISKAIICLMGNKSRLNKNSTSELID